ncbi:unnamed protein product [Fraxinus pennsylvanica]|uniref:SWIM-type domain-containing protein n=1 Tax=Fraxinus pennsylvanica TaxID=56036 RepID=A0AAD1ZBN1_9LAMI|nr:unnamed protein product [Fraxinus pennsylvanica]
MEEEDEDVRKKKRKFQQWGWVVVLVRGSGAPDSRAFLHLPPPSPLTPILSMTKGKLILICQSGGEFITHDDGTLSYEGGEANAVNINQDTSFEDLIMKLAEMSNLDHRTISIKYFLPGNRRNLITLRNNKDLKRMIDFHGHSVTADVFVNGKEGFDRDAIKIHASRENVIKLAETVNHVGAPSTSINTVALDVEPLSAHAIAELDAYAPLHAPTGSAAASDADGSSGSHASTASSPSSEHDSDYDSDYKPRVSVAFDINSPSPTGIDTSNSPADAVKKRRRTASWKSGAHGPMVVAVGDNDVERRSRKRKNQNKSTVAVSDDSVSAIAFYDDDLPEKVVAEWKDRITGVGQDFKSVKEFREALQKYAVAHRFVYKLKKNDANRVSGICIAEGCSWKIHASWVPADESFRIKKFDNTHTCGGESWKNAHPSKNWRNSKGPFNGEGRGALPGLFLAAGHAARLNVFKKFTEQIREISPNAYDWVIQIEPEQWTSSLFKGEPYNHITQHVAEPYAKLMEEIRESTIMQKIESLICMVSELINTRQTESSKWTTKLTPSKEKKIQDEAFKAENLQVFMASDTLFEVHDESTHVVNIEKQDCTCLEWKECGLPCRHAIASFNIARKSVYDYCPRHFSIDAYKSTYSESINHIPEIGAPVGTEETDSDATHVLPPPPRSPDQQHKAKIKIEDPDKRTVTCSKCKQLGHNKASCKTSL